LSTECAFLLDDRGDVLLQPHSRAIHADGCERDVLARVKESGHVAWTVHRGHVRLRLRPSLVSPAAYARVMEWPAGHRPERVLLSYFVDQHWDYEFLRKPADAARRVRWLIELYGGGGYCNARRRTLSISSGLQPKSWRHAIEFWRGLRDELNPAMAAEAFDRFFAGQWILYARAPHHGFSVSDFGANHSEYVRKWLRLCHGGAIPEPSDSVFSQSSARVYQSVTGAFEPRVDETDAIAHWIGYGRRRSRFRRLVLPFRSQGQTWVLSGIDADPTIELLE
jgi:hypothetical protein